MKLNQMRFCYLILMSTITILIGSLSSSRQVIANNSLITKEDRASTSLIAQSTVGYPDALCWYHHEGWQTGLARWANNRCTDVGNGRNRLSVSRPFATSNGVIYGIKNLSKGELYWYRHEGWQDGSSLWANNGNEIKIPTKDSSTRFKTIFATSDGVIYAINQRGELYWYRHEGWQDGSNLWANNSVGIKVGYSWSSFRSVFASSNGVIYAIEQNGDLFWCRHNGWQDGSDSWEGNNSFNSARDTCTQVGSGWKFARVFASSNGVIYGVKHTGELYWYRHEGWQDGSIRWANGGSGIKIGSGWRGSYPTTNVAYVPWIFATDDGIIYRLKKNQ